MSDDIVYYAGRNQTVRPTSELCDELAKYVAPSGLWLLRLIADKVEELEKDDQ